MRRLFLFFQKSSLHVYTCMLYYICGQKDKDICFGRLNMKTKKKSNQKIETANIYLEIAKNVIGLIVAIITFIKSLGN
jgi:hypothetical protein